MPFIYLDYNATTPIDPRVAEAMTPFLTGGFGNPSSTHLEGRKAKAALEEARGKVAECLGCGTEAVVFTSGGTEANNLAIRGVVEALDGGHVITSAVEHPAVLEVVRALERQGRIDLTVVGVDSVGRVDSGEIAAALRDDTVLVSLMLANNEVGTLQPVAEVVSRCRERGVLVHTDAAQAIGKIPVDIGELGVDMLSVAGHKFYGPKGIGALVVRDGVRLVPQMRGAGHERGLRAGTENVLLAVGLGAASEVVHAEAATKVKSLAVLRDRLAALLKAGFPSAVEHGDPGSRLPNTLSIAFPGIEAAQLLLDLGQEVAASAGAACHAEGVQVSHVLDAMGIEKDLARGTVRLSVGRFTTTDEVECAAQLIVQRLNA